MRKWFLCTMLLLLLTAGGTAYASDRGDMVSVGDWKEPVSLTSRLLILKDQDHSLTLGDLLGAAADEYPFVPYEESGYAGSQSDSAYWVTFRLHNPGPAPKDVILELEKPQLSYVGFFRLDDRNRVLEQVQAGRALPFKDRLVNHRNFIFPLTMPAGGEVRIYLRVQTDSYLQLPLKLWTAEQFAEKEQQANLALGMFYGTMLVMAGFNAYLYLLLREKAYLYYVLFIISFTLLQANWDGLAYQYLWPVMPNWDARSNPVAMVLTGMFAVLFSLHFLSVRSYSVLANRTAKVLLTLQVVLLPVFFLLPVTRATQIAVYLTVAALLVCVYLVAVTRFRNRSSYFYSMAWLLLMVGSALNLLAAFKLLPLVPLTLYGPRIGMAAEAVLLSIAMADRYNTMKQAKMTEEKQGVLLQKLHEVTKTLTSTHDMDRLLDVSLTSLSDLTGCETGWIFLRQEEGMELKAKIGDTPRWREYLYLERRFKERFKEIGNQEPEAWSFDEAGMKDIVENGAETCLAIPIVYQQRILGFILLCSRSVRRFSERERSILTNFASQIGISIENVRMLGEINRMATTDGLTGAFNRVHFHNLMERYYEESLEAGTPLTLLMADIDYFKSINDRFGHLAGDRVIRDLAHSLRKMVQPGGVICRFGGEEFMVLLPGRSGEEAYDLAENIRERIGMKTLSLDSGATLQYTISLGLASIVPGTGTSIEAWIQEADAALYRAKANGRNRVEGEGQEGKPEAAS